MPKQDIRRVVITPSDITVELATGETTTIELGRKGPATADTPAPPATDFKKLRETVNATVMGLVGGNLAGVKAALQTVGFARVQDTPDEKLPDLLAALEMMVPKEAA